MSFLVPGQRVNILGCFCGVGRVWWLNQRLQATAVSLNLKISIWGYTKWKAVGKEDVERYNGMLWNEDSPQVSTIGTRVALSLKNLVVLD